MRKLILLLLLLIDVSMAMAQSLYEGFVNPPQEARPRVWWHWMDGNITKDGLRKDIEWMNRVGIGGFHCFEAGLGTAPIVNQRLIYMTPQWKEAFREAVALADSMGMEVAIASCPGWSNTGGPWVTPEDAMKKLVWSETVVSGGKKVDVQLPLPPSQLFYKDAYVVAVRVDKADMGMDEMKAQRTESAEGADTAWVQYQLAQPYTIKALSIVDGHTRSVWAAAPAPVTKYLEASHDGITFWKVCDIPHGGIARQSINIPPTTAKFFRVVFLQKPAVNPQLTLYTVARVDHAEEKAGFATPSDLMAHPTKALPEDAVAPEAVVDVTDRMDADGRLCWAAPKGNWRVYRFGYTLTGQKNHPAPKEATGWEVSKIDKEAFSRFLNYYLGTYRDATGGLMGERGLHYLVIDSYEAGCETWTPQMAAEFEKRRGYSLLPWMPVLTGQLIGSAEQSEEFLFDWRTTIGELIEECMYVNAAEIAHKHGMETYFESHENGRLYLVDGMAAKCQADIPMAATWVVVPGVKSDNSSEMMGASDIRESASVAHLYGKKMVAAESMTVNGALGTAYSFYPGNLKMTADLEMANGTNRFVIHECAHQPVDDKKPGLGLLVYGQWFNRHETWAEQAKVWTDYLARSCYLLQQGRNVADILYYYGEDDVVTSLFAHRHPDIPASYNYDYLNKNALLDLVEFDGTHFVTPSGARYSVLLIDTCCVHFSSEVADKLDNLKRVGAPVFDLREHTVGKAFMGIAPDCSAPDPAPLRYVHRSTDGAEIFWVNNPLDEARTIEVTFRVSGRRPMVWHPETGQREEVPYQVREGVTVVRLCLTAYDAVFVVFDKDGGQVVADGRWSAQSSPEPTLLREIDTPWTVTFDEQWGGPRQTVFNSLASYTENSHPGIKYYSGTAVYHNSFAMSRRDLKSPRLLLSLGQVGSMAEVIVNGQSLGTLWKAPYEIDITNAVRRGSNTLEIRVVNPWRNRLIGDAQPDCTKPFTYTSFSFFKADAPLMPAGLMGPVEIKTTR